MCRWTPSPLLRTWTDPKPGRLGYFTLEWSTPPVWGWMYVPREMSGRTVSTSVRSQRDRHSPSACRTRPTGKGPRRDPVSSWSVEGDLSWASWVFLDGPRWLGPGVSVSFLRKDHLPRAVDRESLHTQTAADRTQAGSRPQIGLR